MQKTCFRHQTKHVQEYCSHSRFVIFPAIKIVALILFTIRYCNINEVYTIIISVDWTDDKDVRSVFDYIMHEEKGQLDVLVNNAYDYDQRGNDTNITDEHTQPSWENSLLNSWNDTNSFSGLKTHCISMALASRYEK